MPIYEYKCLECKEKFDKFVRSMTTEYEIECPRCHSLRVEKALSLFGTSGLDSPSNLFGSPPASACIPGGT